MKATPAEQCRTLEHIPNIGPALAADLRRLGLNSPASLIGQDPYALYERLSRLVGQRQDPCVLDNRLCLRLQVEDLLRTDRAMPV